MDAHTVLDPAALLPCILALLLWQLTQTLESSDMLSLKTIVLPGPFLEGR
jgi:hypothetical protein